MRCVETVAASVRGGPGLQAGRAGQQCEDDGGERRQLAGGEVTGASDDPGVDREGQGCPFEWQLRQVGQQSPLPAAQLEPDRDGASGNEGRDDEVAGMATDAALREVEQDQ